MRRRKKKQIETKYIVLLTIVLIAIFIAIFSFVIKDKRKLNPVEKGLKDVMTGVNTVVMIPFNFFNDVFERFAAMSEVYEENRALKKQLQNYNIINTQNEELREDNADLKEILNLKTTLSDYDATYATTTSRNVNYWYNTITLDKGTHHGIKEDMIVINQDGLIGTIIKTSSFSSTVKLVTTNDNPQKISVVVKSDTDRVYGTIKGYDKEEKVLLIELVTYSEDVNAGATVMTSGLSGKFPSGILVGTVVDTTRDKFGLAKILKVKSNVDFDDIRYVSVLKRKETEK